MAGEPPRWRRRAGNFLTLFFLKFFTPISSSCSSLHGSIISFRKNTHIKPRSRFHYTEFLNKKKKENEKKDYLLASVWRKGNRNGPENFKLASSSSFFVLRSVCIYVSQVLCDLCVIFEFGAVYVLFSNPNEKNMERVVRFWYEKLAGILHVHGVHIMFIIFFEFFCGLILEIGIGRRN